MKTLSVENQQTTRYGLVFAANLTSQQSKNLSDAAFRLWIILHTYSPSNPSDGWTVGAETLANDAGFSRSTFFRALSQLKEQKLISVVNRKGSGKANRYILVNANGVKTLLNGVDRGVTSDSPKNDYSHSFDTGGVSPVDTLTGVTTGASFNNPPNPPRGGNELASFLGKQLDELFSQLEKLEPFDQCDFLLRENARDYAKQTKQSDWDLKAMFKSICVETTGDDAICYAIADSILARAPSENGRKRSANKRRAFLTECQSLIREYGERL